MAIMNRDLTITIQAGRDTCQDCDYRSTDECDMFGRQLDDEGHRLAECLAAEGKAIDRAITAAQAARDTNL